MKSKIMIIFALVLFSSNLMAQNENKTYRKSEGNTVSRDNIMIETFDIDERIEYLQKEKERIQKEIDELLEIKEESKN